MPARSAPESHPKTPGPQQTPAEEPEAGLAELRTILSGPERERLHQVETRFEDDALRASHTGRVLPEAVMAAIGSGSASRLGRAFTDPVTGAIQHIAEEKPDELSDLLAPVIAPSVAKAIHRTFDRMVQSLNHVLEHSLSPRSFAWRFEAWRTGCPFAELVLLKTLRFRVEQVFLIHRETSLVLAHASAFGQETSDPDMVAGMLAAIRDFARDSFNDNSETVEDLETLHFGNLMIWMEQSASLVLAGVVRGKPDTELRDLLRSTLLRLAKRHRHDLRSFSGDTHHFQNSLPDLEECLLSERSPTAPPAKAGFRKYLPFLLLTILGIAWLLYAGWAARAEERAVQALVREMNTRPGVAVLDFDRSGGAWNIHALRDPLSAAETDAWLESRLQELPPLAVAWDGMISTDDSLLEKRIVENLTPPDTVQFTAREGRLILAGQASSSWADRALPLASVIPGIRSVDVSALKIEHPALTLEELLVLLAPPDGVSLSLGADRVLSATGVAPAWWIEATRARVATFPDVSKFDSADLLTHEEALLRDIRNRLQPPDGLRLALWGDSLVLNGPASNAWITQAMQTLENGIPGVRLWDFSRVENLDQKAFDQLAERIAAIRFQFGRGSVDLPEDQSGRVEEAAALIAKLPPLATALGKSPAVIARGSADWEGSDEINMRISLQRAERIREALITAGVGEVPLTAEAVGAIGSPAEADSGAPRRVELIVTTTQETSP